MSKKYISQKWGKEETNKYMIEDLRLGNGKKSGITRIEIWKIFSNIRFGLKNKIES